MKTKELMDDLNFDLNSAVKPFGEGSGRRSRLGDINAVLNSIDTLTVSEVRKLSLGRTWTNSTDIKFTSGPFFRKFAPIEII